MKCPACGKTGTVPSPYCPACGERYDAKSVARDTDLVCRACGKRAEFGSAFCSRCGIQLGSPPSEEIDEGSLQPEGAYLEYRGWPFATFHTVTQTREQFRWSLALVLTVTGAFSVIFAIQEELGIAIVFALLMLFWTFLMWAAGRIGPSGLGAEEDAGRVRAIRLFGRR